MAKPYDVGPGDKVHPGNPVTVDRYTAGARINHWITAASLVLLALSGLALFHPSLFFLTGLFGGGETTRAIHPWIGVVLFFGFLGPVPPLLARQPLEGEDGTWMRRLSDVLRSNEEKLPEVGKYNAGQKMVFWLMSILIIILICSGSGALGPVFRRLHDRWPEACGGADPFARGDRDHLRVDRARLCRDLGARHDPRHGEGIGHRRLGVAPSSQMAAGAGHRQG